MGRKKQKGQSLNRQRLRVDEQTRIRLAQILEEFLASNEEVYKFEANLTNDERALVHQLSQKMGLKSKSSGSAKNRRVSVLKTKKKAGIVTGLESLPHFTFSEEAQGVLRGLFTQYPPGDGDMLEEMVGKHEGETVKPKQFTDDVFARPSMNNAKIAKKLKELNSRRKTHLVQITRNRSKLPIAAFEEKITSTVVPHQVVLISGETGCGKTTQVPQFILEHAWGKGEVCKIVCTQPRRISATSVAERIAAERGETVGENIGYKIRLESKGGKNTSVMLCTTGVLLRVMVAKHFSRSKTGTMKDDISDITHIIMDEIHERDRYSDFLMAIIRDLLPSHPNLRLILMSATIDAERFSQYFGGCPVILVPGFTYPVKTFYLEDVLSIVKSTEDNHPDPNYLSKEDELALDEAINLAWSNDDWDLLLELVASKGTPNIFNYQHSLTGLTALMVFAGKGRNGDLCMLLSLGADCHLRAKDGATALEIAERENQQMAAEILKCHMEKPILEKHVDNVDIVDNGFSNPTEEQDLLDRYLAKVNPELVDVVLIEQLIQKICTDSEDGGILVFLAGWDDINKTRQKLLGSPFFNTSKFTVIPLHSLIPSVEQKKVFMRPPPGCRKVVLSTNIAETAITIDDIVYVIDTGRMKEKNYDPYNNVSTLQSSWVSKASAKQREGRAGRCQPGICYHLYSKLRAASLPDFQVPELRRMPVEELCLQVKMMDPSCKIEEFLRKTLDPPLCESIRNAIIVLQDIGALSLDEKLTKLGERLGALPVHPLTSKMLFFAILMNCLDPALTLACASDLRDPFTLSMKPAEKKRAAAARSEFASLYGGCSDQLTIIAAFECWNNARRMGLEGRFCYKYCVSSATMHMIFGMRKQLQAELVRNGFLPAENLSSYNINARDPGILHGVLVAGWYPMVGRLYIPSKGGKRLVVETASGEKVLLSRHSTNYNLSLKKNAPCPLVVYDEITRHDGFLSIRSCSLVGPLPLLLLSTEIAVAPAKDNNDDDNNEEDDDEGSEFEGESEDGTEFDNKSSGHCEDKLMLTPDNIVRVIMDRWLYCGSTSLDVAQLYCLRERLSAAVLYKVKCPRSALPPVLGDSVFAISRILSSDGLSGLQQKLDGVDTLTDMVSATNIDKQVANIDKPATIRTEKGVSQNPKEPLKELINQDVYQISGVPSLEASISTSEGINDFSYLSTPNKNSLSQGPASSNGSQQHGNSLKRHRGS